MREREEEGQEGTAVEVEIYSGVEFTRFYQGPSRSPLKNTWCKLTLASRERAQRGRKEGARASGRERSRHEQRKFGGLL